MAGMRNNQEQQTDGRRSFSPAVGFGTSFAVGMILFTLGGRWLDERLGKESLFTLIGVGLGLLYGAYELWKLVTMANQQQDEDDSKEDAAHGTQR